MEPEHLSVGCETITRKSQDVEAVPLKTPNGPPDNVKELVTTKRSTWELRIGELETTVESSYHQHQHRLSQGFGRNSATLQLGLKVGYVCVDVSQISESNKLTCNASQ